ncbi:MAG: NIPSNAP family protein, partial [Opitutia bacterium TMED67]
SSKEAREKSWKGFLNDPDWKAAYKASIKDGRLVKKIENVFLKGTDFSAIK